MFENEKFDEILTVLRSGGTILYPTDTIWGIGCDATNEAAVEKIMLTIISSFAFINTSFLPTL